MKSLGEYVTNERCLAPYESILDRHRFPPDVYLVLFYICDSLTLKFHSEPILLHDYAKGAFRLDGLSDR